MSVKECLEAFLAHVECMKDEDGYGDDGYTREFQCLKQRSVQYRVEGTFPAIEGEKELNRKKNRYKDIIPFDYTRVKLDDGKPGDYINANFIKGANGQQAYIASQGPLLSTVIDFWRMLWEYAVHIVIMACNEYEGDKLKCARYWPEVGEFKMYGEVRVTHQSEDKTSYQHFVVRIFEAEVGDVRRTLYQFHYIGWPDHGIPSIPSLLELISLVREHQPSHTPAIVVHCSAGCGRTGTICAIDYAWSILKLGNLTQDFNLFEIIGEMRKQRPAIVQAKDQYIAVHHAVQELFKRHLAMIQNHSYQNVDTDGNPILIGNINSQKTDESDPHLYEPVSQSQDQGGAMYAQVNRGGFQVPRLNIGHRKQADSDAPDVPVKNLLPRDSDSDRSSESIESSPKDSVLALGRKFREKVSQTFTINTPANAPTQGSESQKNHGAVFFKGNDISFAQRLRKPQGPRKVKLTTRDSSGKSSSPQPKKNP